MWVKANPNPGIKNVPDCVIRAISIALDKPWLKVYDDLYQLGRVEFNVSCSDDLWGKYLYLNGCRPFLIPENCPLCVTIDIFSRMYPIGRYIIGTGSHAVAVIDGNYYDTWDSGNERPAYFWKVL